MHDSRTAVVVLAVVGVLVSACAAPAAPPRPVAQVHPSGVAETAPGLLPTDRIATDAPATAGPAVTRTPRPDQMAQNMTLVGSLPLNPQKREAHGDVAVYHQLAFVGTSRFDCSGRGVPIIDLSDPAQPTLLATTPGLPDVAMEDMAALTVGERAVLAIGLQPCARAQPREAARTGLDLVDISDPRHPQRLAVFEIDDVHELTVTQTPDGRSLALLAVSDLEVRTAGAGERGGTGDLVIVDISDPREPRQLAEWGILDAPELGPELYRQAAQGSDPAVYLHSVRANHDGTRALLSYWDAGVIILDLSNPAQPRYLGRTAYAVFDEGNAHSVAVSADGTLLVQADEDVHPTNLTIASNAFAGEHPILVRLVGARPPTGPVVAVGRGCPAGSVPGQEHEDPYTTPISGTDALIDPGGCAPELKLARAQRAGAKGVILYGEVTPELFGIVVRQHSIVLPDGKRLAVTVPVILASEATGQALAAAPAPVAIQLGTAVDGWGGLRLFDISDPSHPQLLSTFATPNTVSEQTARAGGNRVWSAHNPELAGDVLYASWYRDGVRAIDVSDPRHPREIGFWTGTGLSGEAPPVDIWGVAPYRDLVLASDSNVGLYVLRLEHHAGQR